MKRLFFETVLGRIYQYTVFQYEIKNGFYEFTDAKDGIFRRLHQDLFRGEEDVKQ